MGSSALTDYSYGKCQGIEPQFIDNWPMTWLA